MPAWTPPKRAPRLSAIERERARRTAERDREATARNAEAIRARCASLYQFVQEAWPILEPSTPFVGGWAIEAMCKHLEAVSRGEILRLLITIPPGTSKSTIVSVFWPAWEWGPQGRPGLRYLATSYSRKNVIRDNDKMRKLVESAWYQELWGATVRPTAKWGEELFINTALGQRDGRPFASMTGGRGDRVIIDDPHSTKTAEFETQREDQVRTFREQLTDRLNDPVRSAIVVVMQRLHWEDVAGTIVKLRMGYVHLNLPMEFESTVKVNGVDVDNRCRTYLDAQNDNEGYPRPGEKPFFTDPRQHDGDLLFPDRFPRKAVEGFKIAKGPYAYAGQYQQRPTPREGGLFKRAWFAGKIIPKDHIPAGSRRRFRAWDFASSEAGQGSTPDYSASVRGFRIGVDYYIDHVDRLQGSAGTVQRTAKSFAETDPPGTITRIPQDPGAGKGVAQGYVVALSGHPLKVVTTVGRGDKIARATPLAIQAEFGHVYLVNSRAIEDGLDTWMEPFLDELCTFPKGANDDMVDAAADMFDELASAPSDDFEFESTGRRQVLSVTEGDRGNPFGDKARSGGFGFGSRIGR